jgi:hypothetical protein
MNGLLRSLLAHLVAKLYVKVFPTIQNFTFRHVLTVQWYVRVRIHVSFRASLSRADLLVGMLVLTYMMCSLYHQMGQSGV